MSQGRTRRGRLPRGLARSALIAGASLAVFTASAAADTTITRYAGTGVAGTATNGPATSSRLNGPQGVLTDAAGDVYITDTSASLIEKVTPSGVLSIVAGTGVSGAPTPGPATSSRLSYPGNVALDAAGNLYIADDGNNVIEKVTPGGTLSIVAGNGTMAAAVPGPAISSPLDGPEGVTFDGQGDLLIADDSEHRILKVTPAGILSRFAGTGGSGAPVPGPALSSPIDDEESIITDSAGNLFISDSVGNLVLKITPGGTLSVAAGNGSQGAPVPGPATSSPLYQPQAVAADALGDIFIADCGNNRVEEVNSSGVLSVIAGTGAGAAPTYGSPAATSALNCPYSVALNADGTLYEADLNNNTIDRIGPTTPGQPDHLTATPGDGVATLSFTPPIDPGLSAISGYEASLDNGATWQTITTSPGTGGALTTTLTGLSDGSSYSVLVRARNSYGVGKVSLSASLTLPAHATVTTPVGTTTGTGTPTITTASSADAVTVPAATLQAGLSASSAGVVSVPLQCPTIVTGVCDASGTLSISLAPTASLADVVSHATTQQSLIARFAGIQVQAGQTRLVATRLSAKTIAYLRAHDIYRVRVTLAISNTLTSGQVVGSTQHVWLYVSALTGCHAATGTISAAGIGSLTLGMTKAAAHKTGHHTRTRNGFEHYCIAGGQTRIAYPATGLLRTHHVTAGRVIIALTGNRHYKIHGITSGTTVTTAKTHLKLSRAIVIGRNTWYLIPGPKATWILKAQHGVIGEIGVTRRSIAHTRAQDRYLLHHL